MTIQALLFDKDGTLIDFESTFAPATKRVIADLAENDESKMNELAEVGGYDLNNERFNTNSVVIAGSVEDIAQTWLPVLDCSLDELIKNVDKLYLRYTTETIEPFDFLVPTLEELRKRNIILGVGTNDSQKGGETHMKAAGVTSYFASIFGYDSGYGAKPKGGMISAFAEQNNVDVKKVGMVGDSEHDMLAGKNAGAISIGVRSGTDSPALAENADYMLDSIADLPNLLDTLAR